MLLIAEVKDHSAETKQGHADNMTKHRPRGSEGTGTSLDTASGTQIRVLLLVNSRLY